MIRLLSGLLIATSLTFPQHVLARDVGATFFRCNAEIKFGLPGAYGGKAYSFNPSKPNEGARQSMPDGRSYESISGSAEVELDGSMTNLEIIWTQSGRTGWPYYGRADLDSINLQVGFGGGFPLHPRHSRERLTRFDPAKLFVEVDYLQVKRLKGPIEMVLHNPQDYSKQMRDLADVPYWGKSASIGGWWPEVAAIAGDSKYLEFRVSKITGKRNPPELYINSGKLDLSIMPEVIERFREVERSILAQIPDRASKCVKWIEPEPPEIDELSTL